MRRFGTVTTDDEPVVGPGGVIDEAAPRRGPSRAVGLIKAVRSVAAKPTVRPWLLAAAAAMFVAMAVVSFRSLPDEGRDANLLLLLPIVLVAAPATLVLNALEYRVMALPLGHRIGLRDAAKVSLTASLANYLPAPGGVAVRTVALKARGSSLGSAVSVNALAGVMWVGAAALVSGAALTTAGATRARGAGALAVGVLVIVASALWAARAGDGWKPTFLKLLAVEVGIVLVAGARVWFAFVAIGQTASVGAAMAIAGSTVIAAAVGIFPAGLGLREAIGGGLAVAVGVPAMTAVAALAVDRVAGPLGLALCAPLVGVRRPSGDASSPVPAPATGAPDVGAEPVGAEPAGHTS